MRPHVRILLMVGALTMAVAAPVSSARQAPRDGNEEVRGLWVLRTSLQTEADVDWVVRTAVDGGYNTVFVQVRGRGDAYYTSTIEPAATTSAGRALSFDPLGRVLDRAHAAGLQVHAWFNVNLVASAVRMPSDATHIVRRRPEWVMTPAALAGRRNQTGAARVDAIRRWTEQRNETVEGLFLSPIPEPAQMYTVSVVQDLLRRYALDGLHLDYVRYPSPDFDYGDLALEAFREWMSPRTPPADRERLDARRASDPLIWTRTYPDTWTSFRRDRLTSLVTRIREVVDEVRPGAQLTAAVVPMAEDARARKLQDWSLWAEHGLLDAVLPMAYATDARTYAQQVADATRAAGGRRVWIGIGAWRLPAATTGAYIQEARRQGAPGFVLFSYDGLLEADRSGAVFTRLRPFVVDGAGPSR